MKSKLNSDIAMAVADLHIRSLPFAFLSSLGGKFLSVLYQAISASPYSCVLVYLDNEGHLCGFISGTVSTRSMYKWILFHNAFSFCYYLFSALFKPAVLKKIFETLLYAFRSPQLGAQQINPGLSTLIFSSPPPTAELLSIAVDTGLQGKGIGKQLVSKLDGFFHNQAINCYKVVTVSTDKISNSFYGVCGFVFYRSFQHHQNLLNEYVKKL